MKLPQLFTLCALPFCLVASKLSSHQKLVDLATAGNGLINLNDATYDLLTSAKRNWSASVQFTALDVKRRCAPCKEFDPSWTAVAKAWATVPKLQRDNHFFATLDFDNGQSVFQKLGLQSAPVAHIYPATEGPRQPANGKTSPLKYDFSHGFEPEPLARQLSDHTPVPIPYKAPIDFARLGAIALTVLSSLLSLRFIAPILKNRWVWAAGTILTSLVMTSGYMFTRIRGVPYTGNNGEWIAPGYQNQFGQEVQVVAVIYGVLTMAFLVLIVVIPRQSSSPRQKAQVYLWTAVIMIVYSILVAVFRVKNRAYPFKLFL